MPVCVFLVLSGNRVSVTNACIILSFTILNLLSQFFSLNSPLKIPFLCLRDVKHSKSNKQKLARPYGFG